MAFRACLHCCEAIYRRITIKGEYELNTCVSGGWLLTSKQSKQPHYWIPRMPIIRHLDDDGHILSENVSEILSLDVSPQSFSINLRHPVGKTLDIAASIIPFDDHLILKEINSLSESETQPIFLWGSHTQYTKPADVYLHLAHGYIYENRVAWPFYRKICSENDAHALYVTLTGLEGITGKAIYRMLRSQVLMSIIFRQQEDGGWYHGEWTDDMESHFRLHCSGMHLLMDSLAIEPDEHVKQSLRKAAAYISKKKDDTAVGSWFLHDELESSESLMNKSPFKWVSSTEFGKKISNMLVLNTHLDIAPRHVDPRKSLFNKV